MIVEGIGMIAADSPRTAAYLQLLVRHQFLPAHVIVFANAKNKAGVSYEQNIKNTLGSNPANTDYFDPSVGLLEFLETNKISYEIADADNINIPSIIVMLQKREEKYFIYSGLGGQILKDEILNCGKLFLHLHPGRVPDYRGSTTVYYSILNENKCFVSAFFMEKKIDAGPFIKMKQYGKPADGQMIDIIYDPYIRADLLVEIIGEYVKTGTFTKLSQPPGKNETYFIIHPVLKHIAILSCSK